MPIIVTFRMRMVTATGIRTIPPYSGKRLAKRSVRLGVSRRRRRRTKRRAKKNPKK
jgi:hypothetical protein